MTLVPPLTTTARAVAGRAKLDLLSLPLATVLLLSVGCAGEGPSTAGRLETLDVADAAALPSVARPVWTATPAGCEGMLPQASGFGVADGEPELVVALDALGAALCVDTYPALESELLDQGMLDEADQLWLGYLATLQEAEFGGAGSRQAVAQRADPTPQPNLVADQDGVETMADPSPQTNDGDLLPEAPPDDGIPDVDPTPQPNNPNHSGAGSEAGDDASPSREGAAMPTLAPVQAETGSITR